MPVKLILVRLVINGLRAARRTPREMDIDQLHRDIWNSRCDVLGHQASRVHVLSWFHTDQDWGPARMAPGNPYHNLLCLERRALYSGSPRANVSSNSSQTHRRDRCGDGWNR